jgi:pSer/pThr/pTyr-binding forkhead associated (FHA) protein
MPGTPAAPGPADGTDGSQAQARLVAIRYGAPTGDEIPLFGQRLLVGRFDPETGPVDVDLTAMDAGGHISRQHGELYREGDGPWMVRDLGSTNGVFVKSGQDASFGPRISAPRPLKDGDELAFGNARFIFKSS